MPDSADPSPGLTPELNRFVSDGIAAGRFKSLDDAVAEGLRMLEEREGLIRNLESDFRRKIATGAAEADRGEFVDADEAFAEWKRRDAAAHRQQKKRA